MTQKPFDATGIGIVANYAVILAQLIVGNAALAMLSSCSTIDQEEHSYVSSPALFAQKWIDGTNPDEPTMQVQQIDSNTYVIRQSLRSSFEAPFIYLLFGREKALLVDTGAGGAPVRATVETLIASWLKRNKMSSIPLIVAHSHSHRDHIAGGAEFASRPRTTVVGHSSAEVSAFFQILDWPNEIGTLNLGGREVAVVPAPGHQPAHVMFYDAKLSVLLSGDAMYPGRLYIPVNYLPDARASVDRVIAFIGRYRVRYVLGAHIEMTKKPGKDYMQSAPTPPGEHSLELTPEVFLELQKGLLKKMSVSTQPQAYRDFILNPVPPRDD